MRLLGRILTVPIAALLVAFAVVNRHPISLDLWPLPWSIDVPAYLAVLGGAVIGLVVGVVTMMPGLLRARRRRATPSSDARDGSAS